MKKIILGLWPIQLLMAVSLGAEPTIPQVKQPKVEKLKVVTTLPVLKAITKEIGGDLVDVHSLSTAADDPHFIKAKPTFKKLVAEADLFIEIGRSLELWVPLVLSSAGNKKLEGNGLVVASTGLKALEVVQKPTRDLGDIHPSGNPHVWLSPLNGVKMADTIKAALIAKDPAHKGTYETNYKTFKNKIAESLFGTDLVKASGSVDFLLRLYEGKKLKEYATAHKKKIAGWLGMASTIDYTFMTYHNVWSYLADEFDLKVFSMKIEEKSGVEPTPKYRGELIKKAKEAQVKHIVAASYYKGHADIIKKIADQIGGKEVFIAADCLENETYIAMMDRILKTLVDFKALPVVKTLKK